MQKRAKVKNSIKIYLCIISLSFLFVYVYQDILTSDIIKGISCVEATDKLLRQNLFKPYNKEELKEINRQRQMIKTSRLYDKYFNKLKASNNDAEKLKKYLVSIETIRYNILTDMPNATIEEKLTHSLSLYDKYREDIRNMLSMDNLKNLQQYSDSLTERRIVDKLKESLNKNNRISEEIEEELIKRMYAERKKYLPINYNQRERIVRNYLYEFAQNRDTNTRDEMVEHDNNIIKMMSKSGEYDYSLLADSLKRTNRRQDYFLLYNEGYIKSVRSLLNSTQIAKLENICKNIYKSWKDVLTPYMND